MQTFSKLELLMSLGSHGLAAQLDLNEEPRSRRIGKTTSNRISILNRVKAGTTLETKSHGKLIEQKLAAPESVSFPILTTTAKATADCSDHGVRLSWAMLVPSEGPR